MRNTRKKKIHVFKKNKKQKRKLNTTKWTKSRENEEKEQNKIRKEKWKKLGTTDIDIKYNEEKKISNNF